MAKQDPETLAAALRENLRKRKERMRAAQIDGAAPVVESGADEEGDLSSPGDPMRPGSWIEMSKDHR